MLNAAAARSNQSPFSTTSTVLYPRKKGPTPDAVELKGDRRRVPVIEEDMDELWEHIEEPADTEDSPSAGHIMLQKQRVMLHYMRLIEHEMPKLVGTLRGLLLVLNVRLTKTQRNIAYRRDFVPPADDAPMIVRSMHYQGEPHPASIKRSLVVPVDKLPLKNEAAVHKFKLIAGPRWTPNPPSDSGVSGLADWGNGYFKISCEDFPKASQNLKWSSDTLDKLIEEANVRHFCFSIFLIYPLFWTVIDICIRTMRFIFYLPERERHFRRRAA